ncbi:nucleoside-triphosphate diphosphatase [Streptococcus gallinaceus]|uniref:dITP/XTP pyrophosphatase n=1 Tax=Streptococcus gallinaceus TaxID=165758 RepID=A0ABV2JN67_9STRE|nr:nucleoside-triphosphate diphosphatase [Streptococcus gallinaceus]MCP1638808.1 XTP/dITP diphosphohydrolase [Streptococcus gallinaceus]MCP1771201.1 XTP/dITP diphosphohydrolase [Streptococcus gallinaceus]
MTKKIYEYKDVANWFIASLGSFQYVTSFLEDDDFSSFSEVIYKLLEDVGMKRFEEGPGVQIHIVQCSSHFHLLNFLVDVINQEFDRKIEVRRHQGAILVSENDQLLSVQLPKNGVKLADFLGASSEKSLEDTILIATKNEGKTKEFRAFFKKMGYAVENLNNYPDLPDVAETGMTFEENARLKAETIAQLTGKMVLADDSGLKVDRLGGLPGVWSARFSGAGATDESNNAKLLHELAMVFEQKDRSAQFHCCLVIAAPERESLVVEANWEGYIAFDAKGENGFGYDPLFIVGETGKRSAEFTLEEKNQISHRAKALNQLLEAFPVWQANEL